MVRNPLVAPASRRHFRRPSKDVAVAKQVDEVEKHIQALEASKYELEMQLEDLERLLQERKKPLLDQISENMRSRIEASIQLDMMYGHPEGSDLPGPAILRWVSGASYKGLCTLVICVNIFVMWGEMRTDRDPAWARFYKQLNDAFLVWYVSELALKAVVFQHLFLCGDHRHAIWNWLDLVLVFIGVLDQWIVPGIDGTEFDAGHTGVMNGWSFPVLRVLRKLRLIRLLRVLRVLNHFCTMDLQWAEGVRFQTFVMVCIGVNSILLGVELDVPWDGWQPVEHALLTVYVIELVARIQHWGRSFFTIPGERGWNVMDFVIVAGGVLESWVIPFFVFAAKRVSGRPVSSETYGSSVVDMLRICRLVRIMRLARLLRSIQPLYVLATGLLKAMQGMQWVITLTVAVLYACSILATSLVGHGIIYTGGSQPPEAVEIFGNVALSFLNLFKIMNDDQSVVKPLIGSFYVQVFFVFFMVVANWSMLAILTSVVSDNMISATMADQRRQDALQKQGAAKFRDRTLREVFRRIDHDNSGTVDEVEFKRFLQEDAAAEVLVKVTGLPAQSLMQIFMMLSIKGDGTQNVVDYEEFIFKLNLEAKSATERTVFHIEERLRAHERKLIKKFESVLQMIGVSVEESRALLRVDRVKEEALAKKRLQCLTSLSL